MNWRRLQSQWGLAALLTAALASGLTFFEPAVRIPRAVFRYMFILDITQSMNVQDYSQAGLPADRLSYAKATLRRAIDGLPCGSEVGLGLFTTQSVHLLFEPVEVCKHLAVIDAALTHVDWRMAWAANSFIAQGLFAAVREIARHDPRIRLVFFTDGQETPPQTFRPTFTGKPGEIRGLVVGVGGLKPATVPRYDRENRLLGEWQNTDIEPPPVSTTDYQEHFEPEVLPREGAYLSWLDESHLKALSGEAGLRYVRLETPVALSDTLRDDEFAESRTTGVDARPPIGLGALVLLLLVYLLGGRGNRRK